MSLANPKGLAEVLVVDNSPERSALTVVSKFPGIRYEHEPLPGIAAARNRALTIAAELNFEYLVFIDDDEVAPASWLSDHLDAAQLYQADVIHGPVFPQYADGVDPRIIDGRFFDDVAHETGELLPLASSNNTLIRMSKMAEAGSPTFDESFSLTGGSDTEFFVALAKQGSRIVWCESAYVTETVPTSRATFKWVFRRQMRVGNVWARVHGAQHSKLRLLAEGTARIVPGVCLCAVGLVKRRYCNSRELGLLARGIGIVHSAMGRTIIEYKRPTIELSRDLNDALP